MSQEEVSVMTTMQPQTEYVDRWSSAVNLVPQMKEDHQLGPHDGPQNHHLVPSDVISMQYMELEEFLLENSDQDGNGKIFIDDSIGNEKHYHVSLEQRGLNNMTNYPAVNNGHTSNNLSSNNNVHLLSIHPNLHGDPNSPPQSSCDSPPLPQQFHHTSPHNNISQQDHLSNTARKSLPRRASTSSSTASSSHLVVTPPHTPQHPSPPNSDIVMSSAEQPVKTKRAVKRSRKESVSDDNKDDKYWRRRAKNNAAAKRSRDLRREKENHIMQRVAFLEKENRILHQEMDSIKSENEELKERLSQYEINKVKLL